MIVREFANVTDSAIGCHAVRDALSAPVNCDAGKTAFVELFRSIAIFFDEFSAAWKDKYSAFGVCQIPVGRTNAQPI